MLNHKQTMLALALLAAIVSSASAQPTKSWTQVGFLKCKVNPSVGFIIFGHQHMECTYTPSFGTGSPQYYDGAINTVGLDVGVNAGSLMGWGVLAPTSGMAAGALAGEYVGVSGEVGLGIGAGANVLIGGSARTFALQPLSLEGSMAVNAVLGVSSLKLRQATSK